MSTYHVARQDYQVQASTHYLTVRPTVQGCNWQWGTDPTEALPMTQEEAQHTAEQYNAIPAMVRHGMRARVEAG